MVRRPHHLPAAAAHPIKSHPHPIPSHVCCVCDRTKRCSVYRFGAKAHHPTWGFGRVVLGGWTMEERDFDYVVASIVGRQQTGGATKVGQGQRTSPRRSVSVRRRFMVCVCIFN